MKREEEGEEGRGAERSEDEERKQPEDNMITSSLVFPNCPTFTIVH